MAEATPSAGTGELEIDPISEFLSYPIGACYCWVDLKLKAPEYQYEYRARPTMDIVVVLDRSRSMSGKKISLMKCSINFILTQLDMQDRLAVVVFDSTAQTIFPFTRVTPQIRDMLFVKIESINVDAGTNLCEGLQTGIKLLAERTDSRQVSSLLLFSDGLPTVGVTEKRGILNAMQSPSNQRSVLHFLSTSSKKNTPYSVNTFGIGTNHDPDMLQAISQAGGGIFHALVEHQSSPQQLANFLGGLLSTYAQQLSLKLVTKNGAKLESLMVREKPELSEDCKGASVEIPDIQLGEERDIMVKLFLPLHRSEFNKICYANLTVSYVLPDSQKTVTQAAKVIIGRSTDAITVRRRANSEVSIQRNRWQTVEAMRGAREKARLGELREANKILKKCISDINNSSTALGSLSKLLLEDLNRIVQELNTETPLTASGWALLTTSMDSHSRQRSTSHNTECYSTQSRANMLSESARFTESIRSVI